jgi:hypothetical protein
MDDVHITEHDLNLTRPIDPIWLYLADLRPRYGQLNFMGNSAFSDAFDPEPYSFDLNLDIVEMLPRILCPLLYTDFGELLMTTRVL